MIESMTPRASLPPPSATLGDLGSDPVHGREYETENQDLQYACTVDLEPPVQCGSANQLSCECARGRNVPLCDPTDASRQVKAKAYPSVRQLRVARDLGDRAVVGSVCRTPTETYASTLSALASRIYARLGK